MPRVNAAAIGEHGAGRITLGIFAQSAAGPKYNELGQFFPYCAACNRELARIDVRSAAHLAAPTGRNMRWRDYWARKHNVIVNAPAEHASGALACPLDFKRGRRA